MWYLIFKVFFVWFDFVTKYKLQKLMILVKFCNHKSLKYLRKGINYVIPRKLYLTADFNS